MGFWDIYKEKRTQNQVSERYPIEPPSEHVGEIVTVLAVRSAETRFGPRWFLDVELENGQRVTFPIARGNSHRDELLQLMASHVPVVAKVIKLGTFVTFDPPE